jgi:hypothetical protein
MVKTKKVKRHRKDKHGKNKRIFTIKNKVSGGVKWPWSKKVAPVPQPYSKNLFVPSPTSVPTPVRSRPLASTDVDVEGSMLRDVPDTTSATTNDSHDTRLDIGNLYPLKEEVKDQNISPGSALTLSPAARQPLTDPRTLAQMNMIQQNRQPASLQSEAYPSLLRSNTTSSTIPPNDKCLLYVSNWLKNKDFKNKIATMNQPTLFEYTNFTNDMENKGIAKEEIDACLQYSGITSHLDSSLGSTTSTQGTGSTEYSEAYTSFPASPLKSTVLRTSDLRSTVGPDTITTSSSTNSDKTYIVKYKLINNIPQEKEVFVQDPGNQTYSRYFFDISDTPRPCGALSNTELYDVLSKPFDKSKCGISLGTLGNVR